MTSPRSGAVKLDPEDKRAVLNSLGHLIYMHRHAQRLTQIELGERAGLSRNYVGALERGEVNPGYETLVRVARGLGRSVHELLDPNHPTGANRRARRRRRSSVRTATSPP